MIEIRQLFQLAEFEDVVRLQKSIWAFADSELLPVRFLVVVSRVGGHVFGAYDGGEMIGFCFAIPGIKPDGRSYLHSHMLGVVPGYQNTGIGRKLKLRQREEALARGIELIEWTFDPLELKNAFLNIEKLGVIVRRYNENQYGVTASPLHGGLPTDRCYAEWWISSERVRGKLEPGTTPNSARADGPGQHAALCISYPADIGSIRGTDPQLAREIQKTNGEKFRKAFSEGLAVTAFRRSETEGTYVLEPWQ